MRNKDSTAINLNVFMWKSFEMLKLYLMSISKNCISSVCVCNWNVNNLASLPRKSRVVKRYSTSFGRTRHIADIQLEGNQIEAIFYLPEARKPGKEEKDRPKADSGQK